MSWLQRPDSLAHRVDVIRRRSTTPADDLRSRLGEMPRIGREILGTRHVDLPPFHLAGHAGVRLRAELARRDGGHLLDALEDDLRTDRAVEADDVRAPLV